MTIKPGDRLVLESGYHPRLTYTDVKVAKVYKNGNFTLEGDPLNAQWRPYSVDIWVDADNRESVLTAEPTSKTRSYSRRTHRLLEICDATDAYRARLQADAVLASLRDRTYVAMQQARAGSLTAEQCKAILTALEAKV